MSRLVTLLVLGALALYRALLSPLLAMLGARCRYYPTCSDYASRSVRKHGVWRGLARSAHRLLHCHPGHPGGVDFP